jgi:hypothetical protein
MGDTGIQSAANIDLYCGAGNTNTCIGLMTSADLTVDGKNVDTTAFNCATPPTYTSSKQTIKSAKMVLKGFYDKSDAGQAILIAEWVGALGTLQCKMTFGTAGTFYFTGPMAVDSIAIGERASGGLVEVTYNLSSNGVCTFA